MKKMFNLLLVVLIAAAFVLTACGGAKQETAGGEEKKENTVPAEYADKKNPLDGNGEAVAAGQKNYEQKCATCHGAAGKGDGVAGASLDPKPAVLAGITVTDGELYWRIAEGGTMAPFNSSMPAWKDLLSEDEIWQVISYIRSLK